MSHEHPASVGTVQERVDYASIVASLAAVDQEVTPDELDAIHDLCRFLDLPPHTTRVVQKFAQEPDHIAVRDALIRLRDSPLRFTLVMDMVSLAYADGRYDLDERRQVRGLAAVMLVSEAEVEQAEDRVRAYNAEVAEEEAVAPVPDSSVETLAQVVAAGVPTATVLALGAVQGGSVVTSGFSALALGAGTVPGIGVAVGLGLGTYYGVHYLFRRVVEGSDS
jgi:uncharacterized tellurite resistance protein B-like protein